MQQHITTWIRSGVSCIQIVTTEEERATAMIRKIAKEDLAKGKQPEGYALWTWTVTKGLMNEAGNMVIFPVPKQNQDTGKLEMVLEPDVQGKTKDPVVMLPALMTGNVATRSIIILKDFHMYMKVANPMLVRLLKEAIIWGRQTKRHLIIVGCQLNMQPELEKEIQSIDLPLPSRIELEEVVSSISKSARHELNGEKEAVLDAMAGLTTNEAAVAAAFSVVTCRKLDSKIIGKIKTDTIKKNGIVEIVETVTDIASVGGLQAVKDWLNKRTKTFSKEAKDFGLKSPKGLLAIGISGSGKSLIAKTVAGILNVPMLRLDGGKIYGMWVGESEKNIRAALHTADAMSPCVLMIDEFEKAFSSGEGDGGTTKRVIGTFLQWMQDKTSQVFVVATANDVSQLPPEILRRGRFDQIFFVDLPDKDEREQIWSIHIKKAGRKPDDYNLVALAEKTDGYTGAEIESIVSDGLFNAYHESVEPTTESFAAAIHETVPLSSTMRERVTAMRRWADGRAINASGKSKVKV